MLYLTPQNIKELRSIIKAKPPKLFSAPDTKHIHIDLISFSVFCPVLHRDEGSLSRETLLL